MQNTFFERFRQGLKMVRDCIKKRGGERLVSLMSPFEFSTKIDISVDIELEEQVIAVEIFIFN